MTASVPFAGVESLLGRLPPAVRERLLTPALLIDLDAARRNVDRVLERCGGDPDRWRPHLKTTKCPEVWSLLLDAGLRRFKVATTRELAVLLELFERRGVSDGDVLVAQGPTRRSAQRLAELARGAPATRVSVLLEQPQQAPWVPEPLGLFLDVNPGGHRTGTPLDDAAGLLAAARAAGPRLRGVHCYEGHLHGPFPGRGVALDGVFAGLRERLAELDRDGRTVEEVVTSGTPAFRHVLDARPLEGAPGAPRHAVSPGTVLFHDLRSELENPELGLEPAAVVLARVVSRPRPGRVTLDAGSKAIAAEAGDPVAVVLGRPELVAAPCNEEHLPLDGPPESLPELDALLELVPRHVCPSVNLHERALAVDADGWRVVEVAARAHELGLDGLQAAR